MNDNFEAFMEQPASHVKKEVPDEVKDEKHVKDEAGESKEVSKEEKQESELIDNKRLFLMNLSY